MGMQFLRAKSEENKRIRMRQIMDAADRLFHRSPYHDITLSAIADEVGLARGGLYKYVTSKEEIFLAVYAQKESAAVDAVTERLNARVLGAEAFSETVADVLEKHLDLFKYHQILNAVIETNVSIERLAEFKRKSYLYRRELLGIVEEGFGISEERAFGLYLTVLYHCVCLYDRIAYRESYVRAMELAGLPIAEVDFKRDLARFIGVQLADAMRDSP